MSSRRNFMQKVGALAAASSMAHAQDPQAGPPQGAPPAGGRGGRGGGRGGAAARAPGPEAKLPMPTVKYGPYQIGRLILGCNGPGMHFSAKESAEGRTYLTPEKTAEENSHMLELGINVMEGGNRFAQHAAKTGEKTLWSARGTAKAEGSSAQNWQSPKDLVANAIVKPISIHHVGFGNTGTDAWWRQKKLNNVREWCKMARDSGVLVAVTSHRPEVIMEIESQGWDLDYYMCCLYKYGRTRSELLDAFKSNPGMMPVDIMDEIGASELYGGGSLFVAGDPPEMLKVVKQCKKPCWVYKMLASGRLAQNESAIEERFKYILSNIKSTDTMVVGMWGRYSDEFGLNKEYVVKYSSASIQAPVPSV
jgi:hypothetical protein